MGMELFLQNGISIRIQQWLWEVLWPGACWYLWGGTRTGVRWDRRVEPKPSKAGGAVSGWRFLVAGVVGAVVLAVVLSGE